MTELANAVGFAGAIIILLGYARNSLGNLQPDRLYNLANFVGAGALAFSLMINFNLPALLLELAWALIALISLIRSARA